MINIIVAVSSNLAIGKDVKLPWNLPSDLKNFKSVTEGHDILMGRTTWESLPDKFRPLPNRLNFVATKNADYDAIGGEVINDVDTFLSLYENNDDMSVFVIGGSEIYEKAFKYADNLILTRVNCNIDGDTFLKGFNEDEWVRLLSSDVISENGFTFYFESYKRK